MTPTLEELLDMGEKYVNRILLKMRQPELAAFYHLVVDGPEPDVLVPCEFNDSYDKEDMVTLTTAMAHTIKAVAVMFVSEAWMVVVPKDDPDPFATPPSRHKDRVEVVALVASDGYQARHRSLKIVRNRRGRIVGLLRDQEDNVNTVGGRMIDGIVPTTKH